MDGKVEDKNITLWEAYQAAFIFIRDYYIRDGRSSFDLEMLLSAMAPQGNGGSSDPAMVEFFSDALEVVRKDKDAGF
ncbi:hypothetical protein [Brevundimonas sp.]|uniref:hypothetical protein n=1 Tax=Brevundimonas sp. TaxID=1871086 RepID=UPI001AC24FA0|nr:hypothetical protein [Brevundimonas sp.]MBN9466654.1 hypothetical protein [Brevundimonas sp.]